jgi:putative endonuclease
MNKRGLGATGERHAARYLASKGYKILASNYRCRYGEIDIIATKMNKIVFVEVKTRSSWNFGKGSEAVNYVKQHKIRKVALYYMSETNARYGEFRFDVIDLLISDGEIKLAHIENAF